MRILTLLGGEFIITNTIKYLELSRYLTNKMFRCPKSYLIVDRDFIIEKVLNDDSCIYKFTQEDRRIARIETESKGFFSYNKHVLFGELTLKTMP